MWRHSLITKTQLKGYLKNADGKLLHYARLLWLQGGMAKYTFGLEVVPPDLTAGVKGSWFRVSGAYLPGTVYVRLGLGANSKYVCTGLLVDSPEGDISTTSLRGIPIHSVLTDLIAKYGTDGDPVWKAMEETELPPPGPSGFGRAVFFSPTPKVSADRPKRGGRGPDKDELQEFATAYKRALNSPLYRSRPMAATAEAIGISVGSAHRWRALCEQKGLLDSND